MAGQDELAGRDVDAFGAAELARAGERRDPPLRDADLAVLDAPSRHREAASHDEVQHRLSL